MAADREAVLVACRRLLEGRAAGYARELENLDEAASRETKSSAGDKYETGREMIAQGRRLTEQNLAEARAALETLGRMAASPAGDRAGMGSLVETSQGDFLLGISIGEIEAEGRTAKTASLVSPIGSALKGRRAGDRVPWRGGSLDILRIDNPPPSG